MQPGSARHHHPQPTSSGSALETILDLHFIETVHHPTTRAELPHAIAGDAFLAGGTWLFSEAQPDLRRLIDLATLAWPALTPLPDGGLEIAATCRFAELEAFAGGSQWPAAPLFDQCCNALWGSFKIRNTATVGGNLCLALPASPMAALFSALEAQCLIWTPEGSERTVPATMFVIGAGCNVLRPGELLRSISIAGNSLQPRFAFRQISLTRFGRSAALIIGARSVFDPGMTLTITAAVQAPIQLRFDQPPDAAMLSARLSGVLSESLMHDDVHGSVAWKRLMTCRLAEEIREELTR